MTAHKSIALEDTMVAAFATIPTPILSDNLDRLQGAVGLTRFGGGRVVGRAFTVKTRPGDNLFVHLSLDLAKPGDVLVVDAGGEGSNAIMGEIMMRYAITKSIAGVVIDGAIRDVEAFAEAGFPCFARSICHRGPYKDGPGAVRVPASIGGMVVNHGDYVVADADGIVAFSPEEAPALLVRANASIRSEEKLMADIAAGSFDRRWLADLIARHGDPE